MASSMHRQKKLMMSNAHSQIEEDIPEEADEGPDEQVEFLRVDIVGSESQGPEVPAVSQAEPVELTESNNNVNGRN